MIILDRQIQVTSDKDVPINTAGKLSNGLNSDEIMMTLLLPLGVGNPSMGFPYKGPLMRIFYASLLVARKLLNS